LSQLAIATLQNTEKLMNYVEGLFFAILKMQIQRLFAVFGVDISVGADILPASVR
jgi:hypothetical protein